MSATANLRRQHDAAQVIVGDIIAMEKSFVGVPTSAEAFRLTLLIAKLHGTLRIHLAQEDRHLYPSLIASGDSNLTTIARSFVEEMGQLAPALDAFVQKWRDPASVSSRWDAFLADQTTIFTALENRIERENTILYPLADKMSDQRCERSAA